MSSKIHELWPHPLHGPRDGWSKLQGTPIFHDFVWRDFFGKEERRFQGQTSAADCCDHARNVHGRCDGLLLTTDASRVKECEYHVDEHVVVAIANVQWLRYFRVSRATTLKGVLLAPSEDTLKLIAKIPLAQQSLAALSLLKGMAEENHDLSAEQFQELRQSFIALSDGHITEDFVHEAVNLLEDERGFVEGMIENYPEVARNYIINEEVDLDIVGIAYRSQQLSVFEELLKHKFKFPDSVLIEWKADGPERVWQLFFEKNPWIFGYGLDYQYLDKIGNRLEQPISATTLQSVGKKVDALMKTLGQINSLCFVEIKTHFTPLINGNSPYRTGCYSPSAELVGGVVQLQGTVFLRSKESDAMRVKQEDGLTLEEIYQYKPKAFLVIGSLSEFKSEGKVAENKYRSFELYRNSLLSPEIFTFDELFERAKHIVQTNEIAQDSSSPEIADMK